MNIKKIFKEKLNEKINSLDTERVHNLKKLFTLIDKTKNIHNKKITIDLKKDIEEILEVKVKEKNEKTKDDFMQAVHLKDGNYFSMGGVKAKMLNLSDKIFRYKANINLRPKTFGCHKYKMLNKKYYNPEWLNDYNKYTFGGFVKNKTNIKLV